MKDSKSKKWSDTGISLLVIGFLVVFFMMPIAFYGIL